MNGLVDTRRLRPADIRAARPDERVQLVIDSVPARIR